MKREYEHEHMQHENKHEQMQHGEVHHEHREPSISDEVHVDWQVRPEHLIPEEEAEITITVKDKEGVPSPAFAIVHEKQMHLLAISKDLSSFQHLHPEYREDGTFIVRASFPQAGQYKLFVDFMPEGGTQQMATYDIHVTGEESNKSVQPDEKLKRTIKGLNFELAAEQLAANQTVKLTFTVSDAHTNKPMTKLEPYLGSAGHVVIVSEDLEKFLHVHPTDEATTGPAVTYMTLFPKAGIYKIWGQFKYQGELFTVPFVIEVPKKSK